MELRTRALSAENELTHPASPADIRARARTEVAREFFVEEHGRTPANPRELDAALKRYSRPPRAAVAGFDLTFSPVKSVSTLWAVAPPEVSAVIEQAHHAAVSDALRFIEREALFTREGLNGARQVETRGLVAAAFTHRDSRAGDPDLHTHVAVANKVQTTGGKWLAIYGRVLYESAVAASETYNTALERHLSEKLGVRFAERPEPGRGKRPVREIVGVDPTLNQDWSKRRRDIDVAPRRARRRLPADAWPPTDTSRGDRPGAAGEPGDAGRQARAALVGRAAGRLARRGRRATRVARTRSTTWWPTPCTRSATSAKPCQRPGCRTQRNALSPSWRHAGRRGRGTHVRAEAQRQVRDTAIDPGQLDAAVGWVIDHVLEQSSVNLTPDLDPINDPETLRRADGSSVYRHTGRDLFTSPRILDAEQQIMTRGEPRRRTRRPSRNRRDGAAGERRERRRPQPGAGRTGPGNGRQRATGAARHRGGRVGQDHRNAGPGAGMERRRRTEPSGSLRPLPPRPLCRPRPASAADTLAKLVHDLDTGNLSPSLSIGPETLVIIDEAGMADTLTLARVIDHAIDNGASVRLIGDDQQLSAIGAGGVLRDIAANHGAARLGRADAVHRPRRSRRLPGLARRRRLGSRVLLRPRPRSHRQHHYDHRCGVRCVVEGPRRRTGFADARAHPRPRDRAESTSPSRATRRHRASRRGRTGRRQPRLDRRHDPHSAQRPTARDQSPPTG